MKFLRAEAVVNLLSSFMPGTKANPESPVSAGCRILHSCHKSPRITQQESHPSLLGTDLAKGQGLHQCSLCSPCNLRGPMAMRLHPQLLPSFLPWRRRRVHLVVLSSVLSVRSNDGSVRVILPFPWLVTHTPPKTQVFSPGSQLSLSTNHGWSPRQRGLVATGRAGTAAQTKLENSRDVAPSSSHSSSQTKKTHCSRKLERNALAEFFSLLKSEMQSLLKC